MFSKKGKTMTRNPLVILFFAIIFFSCNENSVDSNNTNPFALNVQVVDSHNNPLKNINVSLWDRINLTTLKKAVPNKVMAATTIRFDLPKECFVSMSMYDLNNKFVDNVVSKKLAAGTYAYIWSTSIPNGTFKCKFITSSDSLEKTIYYHDSIYVVLIAPDPSISIIGKTDANGKISTSNTLLFASLYQLPSIPYTSEDSPAPLDYFTFSDSVTICLSDESFSTKKLYYCEIRNDINNIKLNWDDGIIQSDNQKIIFNNKIEKDSRINSNIPKDWKLSQNYPNPFD